MVLIFFEKNYRLVLRYFNMSCPIKAEVFENGALTTREIESLLDTPFEFIPTIMRVNEMLLSRGDGATYETVLENIIIDMKKYLHSDIANVTIIGEDSAEIKCITQEGDTQKVINSEVLEPHHGLHARAITHDVCIISQDILTDPRASHATNGVHPHVTNFLSMPISDDDGLVGQIAFGNSPRPYTISQIRHTFALTHIIAVLCRRKDCMIGGGDDKIMAENQVNQTKDRFLATMSHELRTPLNGIVGMITMLQDAGPLTSKQREYVRILEECSYHLMNLMNNILDFSKMASNRFSLVLNTMNLRDCVHCAADMIRGKINDKGLGFVINISENIPQVFSGDEQRLIQILNNLLSNATKFTSRGSILVDVSGKKIRTTEYCNSWRLDFRIKDTGVGIPIDEQLKIFDIFHQTQSIDTMPNEHGTGLGLSIVKELVRLMGGKIVVESDGIPNKGSTFKFFVVMDEDIDLVSLKEQNEDLLTGTNILIVDDRIEMRMQLTEMLFKWGCMPTSVSSAEEALQYMGHSSTFKCVFVDICMPMMSGVELAQEIRERYPETKLIAISSIDNVDGVEIFDHFLYKPIKTNKLFVSLIDCLRNTSPAIQIVRQNTKKMRKKKSKSSVKILIAEDDHNNAYTLRELLEHYGVNPKNIIHVENGEKAINEVKKHKYDLIFMDVLMPIMDGIEATRRIKSFKHPPIVIAVSAAVRDTDKARAREVGFDRYVTKPIIKNDLYTTMSLFISKKKKK